VASVADDRVEFTLGAEISSNAVAPITLLLAIFKFDRMEWAIEKCTELNVATIVPVIARRTEKHLALAAGKRVERWRRIAREASQQSRRAAPPKVENPIQLAEALRIDGSLRVVLAENERRVTLNERLQSRDIDSLALAIGAEGGWTEEELRSFADSGWTAASLGNTILRAETAAIAAMAIATANL
jgi:16S rRNA (uracil1498-N3)-methyltransferase